MLEIKYSKKSYVRLVLIVAILFIFSVYEFIESKDSLTDILLLILYSWSLVFVIYLGFNRITRIEFFEGNGIIKRTILPEYTFSVSDIKNISTSVLRINKKSFIIYNVVNKKELLEFILKRSNIKGIENENPEDYIDVIAKTILDGTVLYMNEAEAERGEKYKKISSKILFTIAVISVVIYLISVLFSDLELIFKYIFVLFIFSSVFVYLLLEKTSLKRFESKYRFVNNSIFGILSVAVTFIISFSIYKLAFIFGFDLLKNLI